MMMQGCGYSKLNWERLINSNSIPEFDLELEFMVFDSFENKLNIVPSRSFIGLMCRMINKTLEPYIAR